MDQSHVHKNHQVKKICPIYKASCRADCYMQQFLGGQDCPVLVDPAGLDVVKDMLMEAARYMDEIAGIDKSAKGGIVDKLMQSAVEGKIDVKRLLDDLEKSLDI